MLHSGINKTIVIKKQKQSKIKTVVKLTMIVQYTILSFIFVLQFACLFICQSFLLCVFICVQCA